MSAERGWAVLLVLSLVAIAWALHAPAPSDGQIPNTPLRPLFSTPVAAAEIAVVELESAGRAQREERHGAWNAERFKRLRLLANARLERVVDPHAEAPGRFGLGSPALLVRVYAPAPDRLVLELRVGDLAPDGLSYYVEAKPGPGIAKLPAYQIENLLGMLAAP